MTERPSGMTGPNGRPIPARLGPHSEPRVEGPDEGRSAGSVVPPEEAQST